MYGSPAMSKDLNLPFALSPYSKQAEDGELQQSQQPHQIGAGGVLRYRSAPSAVLGDVCEELLPPRSSGQETESMFPRFAAPDPRDYLGEKQTSTPAAQGGSGAGGGGGGGGFSAPHAFFQWNHPPQQEHDQHLQQQQQQQQHMANFGSAGGSSSALLRQGSSPGGLFANLNIDSGFGGTRGMGSGGLSFVSRQGSLMSHISEIGNESIPGGPSDDGGRRLLSGYPVVSWDESVVLSDSFNKRIRDPSEVQNGEMRGGHQMPSLAHHLSLPKSSAEMAAMERFLQIQDAVPCKVRAKRGCATHPRSIAERVRRTRISERIKKLQELVPNMDKQTNTADMLDLAVDYIKDLQRQAKALSDSRANCTCSSRFKP